MQLMPINLSSHAVKSDVRLGLAVTCLYTLVGMGIFSLSCEAARGRNRVPPMRTRAAIAPPNREHDIGSNEGTNVGKLRRSDL